MDEKPITTLGPWSYHNPIDMAADEQSFSVDKEVRWMDGIDKKIEALQRACTCLFIAVDEGSAKDVQVKADAVINQLKECREQLREIKAAPTVYFEGLIEQRTRRACFKAGWAWIQDGFGEQFGYDPTDDTDKEDFKQALYEAKIDNNQRK